MQILFIYLFIWGGTIGRSASCGALGEIRHEHRNGIMYIGTGFD